MTKCDLLLFPYDSYGNQRGSDAVQRFTVVK